MNQEELKNLINQKLNNEEKDILERILTVFSEINRKILSRYLSLLEEYGINDAKNNLSIPKFIYLTFMTMMELSLFPVSKKYNISIKKGNDIYDFFLTIALMPVVKQFEISQKTIFLEFINNRIYQEMNKAAAPYVLNIDQPVFTDKDNPNHKTFMDSLDKSKKKYSRMFLENFLDFNYIKNKLDKSDINKIEEELFDIFIELYNEVTTFLSK
ncbi:MAG: hypothetical protein LBR53_07105 [Deltaproteobacteria bacterium]|jgi:hypothetical protein|nr:hypothetical protein [Deltaproteobacteria bacterium]